MNCTVTIDWRSFAALGVTTIGLVLVIKNPDMAKDALVHVSDAVKECVIVCRGNH